MEFNGQCLLGATVHSDLGSGYLRQTDKLRPAWENANKRFHNSLGYDISNSEQIVHEHR